MTSCSRRSSQAPDLNAPAFRRQVPRGETSEGMPLSEGATRARHARRLLQKVLDYAPTGTAIHPIVRIGRH